MKLQHQLKITAPNQVNYLPIINKTVASMAEILGFGKMDIAKIELGLEEAFVNILNNAFAPGEEAFFDVILQPQTIGLKIILKEKGIPFDPVQVKEFDPEKVHETITDTGLGIFLMQKFVDEVSFLNLGKEGKETHLFKYFNDESVEKLMTQSELQEAKDAIKEEPLPRNSVKFSIRGIKESEAIEISKCAYSSYGYSYINEDIYYPDRIWKQNQTGELISLVPVTTDGKIMGHCALEIEERDPMFPQLGMAFIMPRFQGQGCMNRAVPELIEKAIEKNFTGIYARGITTHPYSQKSLLKFNFKDTALLLSSGPEREYKGIVEGKTQRESVMLLSYFINKPELPELFVPSKYVSIVKKIYENLGVEIELSSLFNADAPLKDQTSITVHTENVNQVAHIMIDEFGADILAQVQQNLRSLCIDRFETIYLHMKMKDTYVIQFVPEFEKMLFFFAGIMPATGGNDELILQYLNNYRIDYDKVQVASEMAEELKSYISGVDPNQKV